jgi:hypothetical protein
VSAHRRIVRLPGRHEERHDARGWRLGGGTLACPRCDAPVAPAPSPLRPADPLGCPYCRHHGAVRDFLSLAEPTRPARVDVFVRTFKRA